MIHGKMFELFAGHRLECAIPRCCKEKVEGFARMEYPGTMCAAHVAFLVKLGVVDFGEGQKMLHRRRLHQILDCFRACRENGCATKRKIGWRRKNCSKRKNVVCRIQA